MKAIRKIAKEKQWKFPVVINEGIKLLKARENIEQTSPMELTSAQLRWLKSQGDRNSSHVYYDVESNPYVLMYHPTGLFKTERVYVPEDKYLT